MLVSYSKKLAITQKLVKLKKNINRYHDKYITISEFNKLTTENFAVRLGTANLTSKNDIADLVKMIDFDDKLKKLNEKVTSSKSKHLLVENELKKTTNICFKSFYWSKLLF